MRLADEISAVWEEVRDELADAFHADWYEVVRTARPADGNGGWTQHEGTVTESGRCALMDNGVSGTAQADDHVIATLSPYSAELPIDSAVEVSDTLRINGHLYLIDDVRRGGNHRLFVVADLRRRAGPP
jgi:hypothetical protein